MHADLHRAVWRKSSRSGGNGGNCVEIARNLPGVTLIRDSKLGDLSPMLALNPAQLSGFLSTVKDGRLDH